LSHFAFVLTYKLHSNGQYRMHGSVINVFGNVNQTQFILSYISYDKTTIGMLFKWYLEYNHPYVRTCSFKHSDVHFMMFDQNAII